jgi:hypothetical protein
MDVRHLDDGQKSRQNQTQQSRRPQSARLRAAISAKLRLEPGQFSILILQGYTLDAEAEVFDPV